jgi:subfamily B ATP-binding cassette protein MsbA
MKIFLRLAKYIYAYKWRVLGGLFSVGVMSLSDTLTAFIIGKMIGLMQKLSELLKGGKELVFDYPIQVFNNEYFHFVVSGKSEALILIVKFAAVSVGIIIVKSIFIYTREVLMSSVQQKLLKQFRNDLFDTVVYLPIRFFDKQKTGGIMSRITNDVNNVEQSLSMLIEIAQNLVFTAIFTTALLMTNWQLTVFTVATFAILGVISRKFGSQIKQHSHRLMENLADISAFLQEKISSVRIVKAYTREEYEKEKFHQKTYSNYVHSMRIARVMALLSPTNEIFNTVITALLVLFTAYLFVEGSMSIDTMFQFLILVNSLAKPVKALGESVARVQKNLVSAGNIFDMIDLERETLNEKPSGKKIENGNVEFRNVSFAYERDREALKDINIVVEAGQNMALVGHSGSGKTTFINLIPRFYNLKTGSLLIDGRNVADMGLSELRSRIAIVPQEVVLFAGTIAENIRYGFLEATNEEIVNAAKSANAHEFIVRLDHGYETEVGERGTQLSGGQRQRLAIARAILRDPKILLLDEATSALDSESEKLVQEALERLMKNRTTFMIAHRLSTVFRCDRILVFENGRIVETGTHAQLLEQDSGIYKRLYAMQTTTGDTEMI